MTEREEVLQELIDHFKEESVDEYDREVREIEYNPHKLYSVEEIIQIIKDF